VPRGLAPPLARAAQRLASGDWERAQTLAELRDAAEKVGFEVEAIERYALRDVKAVVGGPSARLLALAFEEALAEEVGTERNRHLYKILYLRAHRR
jgi:hypothetical protein